jgi:hypothetical protein
MSADANNGLKHGILSVFGLGSLYDPLGDLKGELAKSISDFNSASAGLSLLTTQNLQQEFKESVQLINTKAALASKNLQYQTDMIWDTIDKDSLLLIFIYMLVIMVVFYILIK